jgi:hypothetical protein
MKIGILTFHCAHNYGAVLQCYALQETLRNMGHEVEVINYTPPYLVNLYKYFFWRRFISKNPSLFIKKTLSEIKIFKKRYLRYQAFNQFICKYIDISPQYKKNIQTPSNYDIYIMGSDQIWNPNITNGFDSTFFGFFPFEKKDKIYISYAASMGKTNLSLEKTEYIKHALKNFDGISVREEELKQYLQQLTKQEIQTVLDPTLLLPLNAWDKIILKPKIFERYILVYQVRQDSNTTRIANSIAKQLNCKVIEISANIRLENRNNLNILETCTPEEFLSLIKYSTCVITTSFHGTVFSILFKKDFFCIKLNDGSDGRACNLLDIFNLSSRMISKESSPQMSKVNYNNIDYSKFESLRQNSYNFLRTYIS